MTTDNMDVAADTCKKTNNEHWTTDFADCSSFLWKKKKKKNFLERCRIGLEDQEEATPPNIYVINKGKFLQGVHYK